MIQVIWYGLIGGVFSLMGGILLLWRTDAVLKFINPLLAFGAGTFLGVSFFDIIPEALESGFETHSIFTAVLIGFSVFFILERVLMRYYMVHEHGKEIHHEEHTESIVPLVIIGDSLHNFFDGVVIALSYIANPGLGLAATFAVAAHEVPQEIADFSILLDRGWSKMKIIVVNLISSLFTILGVLLGYFAGNALESFLPFLIAGVAGMFIYLAASNIIPEIHHRAGHKVLYKIVIAFLFGLVTIGYIIRLTHG